MIFSSPSVCHKTGDHRDNMVVHYGAAHGRVLDFVPEEVRARLEELGVRKRDVLQPRQSRSNNGERVAEAKKE